MSFQEYNLWQKSTLVVPKKIHVPFLLDQKKFDGTLITIFIIRPKKMVLFYHLKPKSPHLPQKNSISKDQKKFGDTLVCRVTLVEKHCT